MNIDEMPAGQEMDALVAEKVMEEDHTCMPEKPSDCPVCDPASYSTDIAAAWKVAEKSEGYGFDLEQGPHGSWECQIAFDEFRNGYADADTAPLAICRAALKAVQCQ